MEWKNDTSGRAMRRRRTTLRCGALALGVAALAPAFVSAGARPPEIPFEELARNLLERHGLQPDAIGPESMADVLRASCVSARLGGMQVWIPRDSLSSKLARAAVGNENVDLLLEGGTLEQIVVSILQSQIEIARMASVGLSEVEGKVMESLVENLEELADKKIGGSALKKLGSLAEDHAVVDVTKELFGLNAKNELLATINEQVARGRLWGHDDLALGEPDQYVLAPTLWQMTEWMSLIGWMKRDLDGRQLYWHEGIIGWNRGYYGNYQFTCFEDSAGGQGDWRIGTKHSLDRLRGATVVDAVTSFTRQCVAVSGREVLDWFVRAISDLAVLRICKTYEPELIGQRATKSTAPTEKFVADNPSGPKALPMPNVDYSAHFQGKSAKDLEAGMHVYCSLGEQKKPSDSEERIFYGIRPATVDSSASGKGENVILYTGPQLMYVDGRTGRPPPVDDGSRMAVAEFELTLGYMMMITMETHEGPSGDSKPGVALGALLRSLAEKREGEIAFDATVKECFGAGIVELEESNFEKAAH